VQQRVSCSFPRQCEVQWIVEAQKKVGCNVIPSDRVESSRKSAVVSPDRVEWSEVECRR
jgi:hypothetical protein